MTRSRRFSIAGLMGAVLVVSLAMAALRSNSDTWAHATFLVTCGIVALGMVGAICGEATDRAWWLGFSVFGGGYLYWALVDVAGPLPRELTALGRLEKLLLRSRIQESPVYGFGTIPSYEFTIIAHCFFALLAAVLGGALARFLFPTPVRPGTPHDGVPTSALPRRNGWRRLVLIGLASLLVFTSAALTGLRMAPWVSTGATILVTWGLLGFAVLGAALNRGVNRARWLGAALFGMSYLAMASGRIDQLAWPQFATSRFLEFVRPHLFWMPQRYAPAGLAPAVNDEVAVVNLRVQNALNQTVPMHFPKHTPLQDVLTHIARVAGRPDGSALPIYVDPIGLERAKKTLDSPVSLDLEGVPLRTSLRLVLEQLEMAYEVDCGVIKITCDVCLNSDRESEIRYTDPFLVTGHCVLALVAASLGSLLAPLVIKRGNEPTAVS